MNKRDKTNEQIEKFNECKEEVLRNLRMGCTERLLQFIGHFSYRRIDKMEAAAHLEGMLEYIQELRGDIMELHKNIRLKEEAWRRALQ